MSEIEKRLTLAQIKDTQEYSVLTGKQQLFVETYITSGVDTGTYDPVVASLTAYTCKSREVARIMSYSLMANIRIIAVLNRHFNREPLEEFIIQVNRAIQNKKVSQAQIWALRLKADVLGFGARLPGTNNFTPGTIPPAVQKKLAEDRKAKRKKPARAPEVEKPWEFADH